MGVARVGRGVFFCFVVVTHTLLLVLLLLLFAGVVLLLLFCRCCDGVHVVGTFWGE